MQYLRNKIGQVGVIQVIGWGATIIATLSGFFWTSLGATNNEVDKTKIGQTALIERVAIVEEAVRSLKSTAEETNRDVKILLQRK